MNTTEQLFDFINHSVSPFHTVDYCANLLEQSGATTLSLKDSWQLETGRTYICKPYPSVMFAFKIPETPDFSKGIHLAGAHTDWPGLCIKPAAEKTTHGYLQANVEIYGGPILASFLDRPLSIAGMVAVTNPEGTMPNMVYVNLEKPVMTIPNLAIHMNRQVNEKGLILDKSKDLMPILDVATDSLNEKNFLVNAIAKAANTDPENILDYHLYAYVAEAPLVIGLDDSMISSPRLDDITSVCAVISSFMASKSKDTIAVAALYDNEEIGSRTKQGADSALLNLVLEKLWAGFNLDRLSFIEHMYSSILLSVDVAHGYHPNYPATCDSTNQPILGQGVCLKVDNNQGYAWDCETLGIIKQLCHVNQIPWQMAVKQTGQKGGSTFGPMMSSLIPAKALDMGVPLLAMHSARELMGAKDQEYLQQLLLAFYN